MRGLVLATVALIASFPALAQQPSPLDLAREAGEQAGLANVCRSKEADEKASRLEREAKAAVQPRDLAIIERTMRFAMFQAEREARNKGC